MATKIVHAFAAETRRYMGPVILDDSDLSPLDLAEGVEIFLVPSNCVDAQPQEAPEGFYNKLSEDGTTWELEAEPVEEPEPEPPVPTIEELVAAMRASITAKRWEVETGGITLINGVKVLTGSDDQARISQVLVGMESNGYTTVPFKAATGWVDLTLADMQGILSAIASHVRACFLAERDHDEAFTALIDSQGAEAALESFDLNAGWPGN